MPRRKHINYKDVLMTYRRPGRAGGLKAIRAMHERQEISREVWKALIAHMQEEKITAEAELLELAKDAVKPRGRPQPALGEEREMKAGARMAYAVPTLRLPLYHLGVKPKGTLRVKWDEDKIVVSRAGG